VMDSGGFRIVRSKTVRGGVYLFFFKLAFVANERECVLGWCCEMESIAVSRLAVNVEPDAKCSENKSTLCWSFYYFLFLFIFFLYSISVHLMAGPFT